jgi:cell division septal protein FtsQ
MLTNQRKRRQEHLLDVKVQTEHRHIVPWLGTGVTALAILAVSAGTSWGLYRLGKLAVAKLLNENPRFAIAQINVENDGVLTQEQVKQLAGVRVGQNLWSVDLDRARRNLELVPVVQRVCVRRVFPNRLVITVEERVALARLQLRTFSGEPGGSEFLVDRDGYVLKPFKLADGTVIQPRHPMSGLPLLTGVKLGDAPTGRRVESERVYQALWLLDKLAQSAVCSAVDIEQIDLSKPRLLTVMTRQKSVMKFDPQDLQQQLRRLAVVLSWAQQRHKTVQMVDLTVERGVPVTFIN